MWLISINTEQHNVNNKSLRCSETNAMFKQSNSEGHRITQLTFCYMQQAFDQVVHRIQIIHCWLTENLKSLGCSFSTQLHIPLTTAFILKGIPYCTAAMGVFCTGRHNVNKYFYFPQWVKYKNHILKMILGHFCHKDLLPKAKFSRCLLSLTAELR